MFLTFRKFDNLNNSHFISVFFSKSFTFHRNVQSSFSIISRKNSISKILNDHVKTNSMLYKYNQLTISSNTVGHPIQSFQIGRFRCPHDDVLHIPPSQVSVGLEGEGAYTSGQGCRCRRARVAGRAKMMQVSGHHLFLPRWTGTVGRRQSGRARLAVPRHLAVLRRAADGQRPDAVRITVAVAVVVIPAAVSRRPHENRPSTVATLMIKATSLTRPPWNFCSKNFSFVTEILLASMKICVLRF